MNIEELVNKYFEGETSCEEERELRRFFAGGIVPEHLRAYRPMFAFLDEESRQSNVANARPLVKTSASLRRRLLYGVSGIAAGILIALALAGLSRYLGGTPENYVIIDGKRYTDARLIHEQARDAFDDVRLSEDEVFATLFSE